MKITLAFYRKQLELAQKELRFLKLPYNQTKNHWRIIRLEQCIWAYKEILANGSDRYWAAKQKKKLEKRTQK
jgi:hypothetical protein